MSQSKAAPTLTEGENESDLKTPPKLSSESPQINGTETDNISTSDSDSNKDKIQTRSKTSLISNTPEKTKTVDSDANPSESSNHSHNTRSHSKTPQNKTPTQEISTTSPEVVAEEPKAASDENALDLSLDSVDQVNSVQEDSVDQVNSVQEDFVDKVKNISLPPGVKLTVIQCDNTSNNSSTPQPVIISIQRENEPKFVLHDDIYMDTFDIPGHCTYEPECDCSTTSSSNSSTRAVAGGDMTGISDFAEEPLVTEESTSTSPDRSISFRETIRNITPRRSIRSVSTDNYRQFALDNNRPNYDSPMKTSNYDFVERVAGVKRKSGSVKPNEKKKPKESPESPDGERTTENRRCSIM